MKALATLNATRHGEGPVSLELIQQSTDELRFARMPYAEVLVHGPVLDQLGASIRSQVEGGARGVPSGVRTTVRRADPFVTCGQGLFNELLPMRQLDVRFIREPLSDLKSALLVATNVPEVPWELLHDGTDFLGLRYEMGRSLRARGPEWRAPRPDSSWQCLIIANPTGDLPTATVEAKTVKESLEAKGLACDYLAEEEASFDNLLECLSTTEYDIIHYSGHIDRVDAAGEYGFVLRGSQFFSASSIKTHVRSPSIAFLNGCNSGAVVQGLTEAFLATGAQMVIGTLFRTPSRGAAAFAEKFYTDFLNGASAGEAMRQARLHVKSLDNCGASWACFVLYGDPRFSLRLKLEGLDSALAKAGFSPADFDASAIKVLQTALAYGAAAEGVSTAILFASLVEGTDPFLRDRLERCRVLELLEEAFKSTLSIGEQGSEGAESTKRGTGNAAEGEIEFSPNVVSMLQKAKEACVAHDLMKITERGLLSGFVRAPIGGAWSILRHLKIVPADLDPWNEISRRKIAGVGGLDPLKCTGEVWAILMTALSCAARDQADGISAIHLFRAMARPGRLLVAAFRRIGVNLSAAPDAGLSLSDLPEYDVAGEPVACSRNVLDILSRAVTEAAAQNRLVEEQDILRAFVANGGGAAGTWLLQNGVPLRSLTSALFLEGGVLDTGRFDESGQKVLDETFEFAKQRGYAFVGRRHLAYGLLSASAFLAEKLREQNRDADLLAEAFHASLPPGNETVSADTPRWSGLSRELIKVLCDAEFVALKEGNVAISDRHLLQAWCADGGGASRQFLIQQGVRLRKLFA